MLKKDLIAHLDMYLNVSAYTDGSKNGLQVDSEKTEIKKVGFAVDATTYIFDRAIEEKVDLLITHHGLYWGNERVMTGLLYERVSRLIRSDIAFYGVHLPLDAHPEVGNNIELVRAFASYFNIKDYSLEKFGLYHGETIGFGIRFEEKISFDRLRDFCQAIKIIPEIYNFWNKEIISSFCAISGGAGDNITDAKEFGYDVFLTGEWPHYSRIIGKELGQSVIFGWHYETETFWVKAVGKYLEEKFNLETIFIDEKY